LTNIPGTNSHFRIAGSTQGFYKKDKIMEYARVTISKNKDKTEKIR
jgi:hypothetical protein